VQIAQNLFASKTWSIYRLPFPAILSREPI
jgi:hypothetical protein